MLNIALLCTNPSPTLRPPMSSVVRMLENEIPVQAPIVKRSSADPDARFKAFELLSQDSQTQVSSFSQDSHQRGTSMDGPWIDSSISLQSKDSHENSSSSKLLKDLYNVNLDWWIKKMIIYKNKVFWNLLNYVTFFCEGVTWIKYILFGYLR